MKVNSLVEHKRLKALGIGCVCRVYPNGDVLVNFGLSEQKRCKPESLDIIDTSRCKEIAFCDLQRGLVANSSAIPDEFIVGNELRQNVGIGTITLRVITRADLERYKRVV